MKTAHATFTSQETTSYRPVVGRWKTTRFLAAALLFLSACSTTPEAREAKHMRRGHDYVAAQKYREAVIEFKVSAQNMPKDAEPLYQLGLVYLDAGAARLAVEAFTKANALNPKHVGAQYQMALIKAGSNKPEVVEDAKRVLTAYIASHSDNATAMGSLALADAKLGNKPEALKMLFDGAAKNSSNLRAASTIIALYAAKGDMDTAKQIAHDLGDRLTSSPEAATLRAQVSYATHDFEDADAYTAKALALKRDFAPALELRLRRELMQRDSSGAEQTTQELAKLPARQTWGAYARMLFAEKKVDEGIAEYKKVIGEHGDDPQLRDEFSSLLTTVRRPKEAGDIVAGTLAKNPKDRGALLQRATSEINKGELDAGAKDVKTLQDMKAFSSQLSFQESRIFAARGQTIRQGDLLTEAIHANPRMLPARLELARLLASSGKSKTALDILDQASPAEKRTADYVFYRNTALMTAGEWDEARKGVDMALHASPSPGFLYQDALIRVRNSDLAGARKSLEASFQFAPADPLTLNLLAQVMNAQKEGPKYIAMLRDAAAKNPHSAVLENTLGLQLERTGDRNGARAAFEAAKAAGDPAAADTQLALLDMRTGALDPARQRLLELVKTHDSAGARMMLAEIETKKGSSPDLVVQHYLKALQLEPANIAAMNNLADFLASRQRKYDDALFWAQKAFALSPTSPVVEDTLGWIYYREGKYDAALPYLEKSLKAADRPVAHYHLAGALASTGDPTRARKEYEVALKEDSKSDARASVAGLFEGKKQ